MVQEQQLRVKNEVYYNKKIVIQWVDKNLVVGESTGGDEQIFGMWGGDSTHPTSRENPVDFHVLERHGGAIFEKLEQKPCRKENFDEKWRRTVNSWLMVKLLHSSNIK